MSFTDFFEKATAGQAPYPYQVRFAEAEVLPHLLRAPTGAGKTATAILGWLWRWKSKPQTTPRRLVYCLPMRVLVEQSAKVAREWLANLNEAIGVHVLMGGADTEAWHLHPEKPTVLIGTQDMLLSRALNRGYAASRFHWPIDFGLLNNDCLWVFDEPQLMANGVSTSAQLAGFRATLDTFGECPSVWMSATLEPGWLDTIDFRGKFPEPALELTAADHGDHRLAERMTAAKMLAPLGLALTKEADDKEIKALATKVLEKHRESEGSQTLVILNTVKRARAVYAALDKLKPPVKPLLIHSRFRPHERVGERDKDGNVIRVGLNDRLQEKGEATRGRIIVATQVVEAGVDISSRTLITELAPWASIVQRIGRCNRTGNDGTKENPARVYWIDLDTEKQAGPYEANDLIFARQQLEQLNGKGVSPRELDDYKKAKEKEKPDEPFLRFEHKHVIRRRDLLDLFDTSPDLSGNDIDISRFVRSDDPDTDVQVFWRAAKPSDDWDAKETRLQAVRRTELCNVPIGSFKKDFLEAGKCAYRFDHLDGEWQELTRKDTASVVPGQRFWVVADQGGYDPELGWSPSAGKLAESLLVELPDKPPKRRGERKEGSYDSNEWAEASWKTLAEHTDDVVHELGAMLAANCALPLTGDLRTALAVAARWHDWGKAHPVFQSGIAAEIFDPKTRQMPEKDQRKMLRPAKWQGTPFIAKAPGEFWGRYKRSITLKSGATQLLTVKRFRHELASALGILALERMNTLPEDWRQLTPNRRWLALYLIASHHGKVRLSIRSMPGERPIPHDADKRRFAAGVWEDDRLPAAALDQAGNVSPPEAELSLATMQLGGSVSWSAAVLALREELGPFQLAYLETVLRAADCRASAEPETEESTNA